MDNRIAQNIQFLFDGIIAANSETKPECRITRSFAF
jgi:hypothetical protein